MLHNIATGNLGLFIAAATATTIVSDPGAIYSITQGTALKTNLYYNAGTGKYRIQNNTGTIQSYFVGLIQTKNSV
jgi:archaellum component FlaG (FlaF/FlaG flagellin family)